MNNTNKRPDDDTVYVSILFFLKMSGVCRGFDL